MKNNQFYEITFSFTQEDVDLFAKVTGDNNPIHIDEEFALTSRFGSRIMHGFLSGSIFSRIIGMYFPGNGAIYLSQSMKFLKPMFVETNYLARVTVIECFNDKNRYTLQTIIFDCSTNEVTLDGEAVIFYKK